MTDITPYKPLTGFKALSFDCYGTLVNWESGILETLQPIISRLGADHPYAKDPVAAIQRFDKLSDELEVAQPTLRYDVNLVSSFKNLAAELGVSVSDEEAAAMGSGPGRWPAFPDTVPGLQELKKHFKLIILSNINDANAESAVAGALGPVEFDAVYTAEQIGSYKPSHSNFRYLFRRARDDLDVDFDKGELLHVARSLTADHVPAKELGLRSVWISRGGDSEEGYGVGGDLEKLRAQGKLGYEWRFDTIEDFSKEVERQFAEAGSAAQ
ncbi:Haloacid dehalogenase [Pleurostoma richardsiae]|uniref:Haloacid dehalogenase n=1 Tax=Pleurostoma richardsiae TaxID=41990 RepID=A0AA38VLG8_9PEZI|nr:Haloacid dehalogenase [Pleurostoma richardsiae]